MPYFEAPDDARSLFVEGLVYLPENHHNYVSTALSNNQQRKNTAQKMAPKFTFGPSAAETVASQLGLKVEEETGLLVDEESGEYAIPKGMEEPITIDEFGGVGEGSRILIENDFNSISAYVEEHR